MEVDSTKSCKICSNDVSETKKWLMQVSAFQPQNDKEITSGQCTKTSKEFDQMKDHINQAVYMDFIETVAENDISNMLTIELLKFFKSHEGIMVESLVYPLVFRMKSTLVAFLYKSAFFSSLSSNDREALISENIWLLVGFCIVKCQAAHSGYDQYCLLTPSNPNQLEWQQIPYKNDLIRKLLCRIMNEQALSILTNHCKKVEAILGDELMSHPGLYLLTLIFSTDTLIKDGHDWRIFEKEKILSIFNLFVSILTQETEVKEDQWTQVKLKTAIEHLHKMTIMLPKSFREIHIGLIKQPIIQDKNSMRHWLNEQFEIIDQATYQIQHAEPLENFVAKMQESGSQVGLTDKLPAFLKSVGMVEIARSKFILAHKYDSLRMIAKYGNFQDVISMSLLLQGLKDSSYSSYREGALKSYGKIPENYVSIHDKMPNLKWSHFTQMSNLMPLDDIWNFKRTEDSILPFLTDMNYKILYLLVLSDFSENASSLRFRSAVLSTIFHLDSSTLGSQSKILGIFFEKFMELKTLYKIGRPILNLFF